MKKSMLSILSIVLLVSCGGSDSPEVKIADSSKEEIELYEEKQPIVIEQSKLVKKSVLGGELSILLPDYFNLMSKELVEIKYPSGNRPTEIYSDEQGGVSIGFSHTANQMELEQLPELMPLFIEQFSNMYPTIKWGKTDTRKINGLNCVVLEFETPAIDTEIYNLMGITVLDGRMLIFTFNCIVPVKSEWEEKASQIINSIQVQ
jgi:hypothetical protein